MDRMGGMDRMDGMDGMEAGRGGGALRHYVTLSFSALIVCLAAACGPMAGTTQPAWADTSGAYSNEYGIEYLTRLFDPCTVSASIDPQKRSFAAMVLALQDQNWTIQKMDPAKNTIFADYCYRDDNRFCAVVVFRCGQQGAVSGQPEYVQPKVKDDLGRWFIALERSFNNFRCYTDAVLREEMSKYGIVY